MRAPPELAQLTPQAYHKQADEFLNDLLDRLEALGDERPDIIADSEYSQGVLTLSVPALGTYVINKQPPNKQIWLSSPVSGPNRYDLIDGEWVSLRDGSRLMAVLSRELGRALDNPDYAL
ncbi:AGR387Cp [Eremothecium gossypii ATCC 10895]|uniref:ferroxidase n=1 Tax=Eremothecium gossypii (strain ATCC 10895 / CBS 109.51 / FGSC 9923 / NRRL Y-1056) TaxID=284811 RepID=Q74Z19_EREGS|nr:AGR387Cp [Eremothecium gossypii ATCC 10895]AAS54877.2 AGR387Cp [Eremothecium gossypii ATCC 10895]AEY99209.1 FAGR387Cp [Eremothecium gossypii FDAG1]